LADKFQPDNKHGIGAATGAGTISASEYSGDPKQLRRWATARDRSDPHPLYVVWEITLKCDLACKHCGSRAGPIRPNELNTAECFDLIHQMAELGVREVTIIGGEAYLRNDWVQIASEITRTGMSCSMATGARNLTQERVDQAVAAGIRGISVSIDGLEATHDAQRGIRGSWRSAFEASQRIADSPIRLTTNSQINKLSMPELPALADLLVEMGSKAWQVQLTVAMGRAADRPDLLLEPYDLLELFPLLAWIKESKLDPGGVRLFPGNNIGWEPIGMAVPPVSGRWVLKPTARSKAVRHCRVRSIPAPTSAT
jgi:sulfatase maturation enzyme AslB (radical SAM superfamily)